MLALAASLRKVAERLERMLTGAAPPNIIDSVHDFAVDLEDELPSVLEENAEEASSPLPHEKIQDELERVQSFVQRVERVPRDSKAERLLDAVRLIQASRPDNADAPDFIKDWVSWGAGTRGTQNLLLGAKARALLQGRLHVSVADIQAVAPPVLRHRILTNFRAEADNTGAEDIIAKLLETVEPPRSGIH